MRLASSVLKGHHDVHRGSGVRQVHCSGRCRPRTTLGTPSRRVATPHRPTYCPFDAGTGRMTLATSSTLNHRYRMLVLSPGCASNPIRTSVAVQRTARAGHHSSSPSAQTRRAITGITPVPADDASSGSTPFRYSLPVTGPVSNTCAGPQSRDTHPRSTHGSVIVGAVRSSIARVRARSEIYPAGSTSAIHDRQCASAVGDTI